MFASRLSSAFGAVHPLRTTLRTRTFISFHSSFLNGVCRAKKPGQTPFRSIMTDASPVITRPSSQEGWKKFGITAVCLYLLPFAYDVYINHSQQLVVGGSVLAVDALLNRETRDGLSPHEQSYLHSSFKYTGAGLALTAVCARSMFRLGLPYRLMQANPCESASLSCTRARLSCVYRAGARC